MPEPGWNECDAYARYLNDGKERVVFCSLGRHAEPGDNTVFHYDPDLEIWWRYAEGWMNDEDLQNRVHGRGKRDGQGGPGDELSQGRREADVHLLLR